MQASSSGVPTKRAVAATTDGRTDGQTRVTRLLLSSCDPKTTAQYTMVSVAPSVANRLLLAPKSNPHVRTTSQIYTMELSHVRSPSQIYSMEPLYAKVQRKPRNTPEDRQQNSLEAFYGGKEKANGAAFVIQRAFRASRLRKQFSGLLSVVSEDKNEVNVDTGLPVVSPSKPGKSPVPDNIDLLILQAAGLETFPNNSSSKLVGRNRKNLRRTQSFKVPRNKNVESASEQGPGPIPQPCPALKGSYDVPKPPQRTVSFLARPQFPNKVGVAASQQRPLPPPPPQPVAASASSDGIYVQRPPAENHLQQNHLRSYSSPAPLSPLMITRDQDEPLPPPPYISPPLPPATESVNRLEVSSDDQPLPPPPPELTEDTLAKPVPPQTAGVHPGTRPPCDSSSSASSIDSGFRYVQFNGKLF